MIIFITVVIFVLATQAGLATTTESINSGSIEKETNHPFMFLLNFSTGITIPSGDYYDGMRSGLALGGGISIPITSRLGIKASGGRVGVVRDDRSVFLRSDEISIEFQDVRLETYLIRYMVALEFLNRSDKSDKNGDSFWYIYTGLGGINNRMTLKYQEVDLVDDSSIRHILYGNDWDYIASLGAGFLFAAGSNFGLDVSFNWDMVVGKGSYSEAFTGKIDERFGISGYLLELRIGLYKMF